MALLRKNYGKYICLIALILLQLVADSSAIKCAQCGGSGEKCKDNLDEQIKDCEDALVKKCFTQIDATKGDIERGCRKPADEDSCKPESCVLSDEGKNTQLICKKCNGDDEKCAQGNVSDAKYSKICVNDEKNCIVKVESKLVVRDCAANVTQCTAEKMCQACTTSTCNDKIFPENRLKCHQCKGSGCNEVKSENSVACHNYESEDYCYTQGDNETSMVRGCKSDTAENKCSPVLDSCLFCNVSDCNSLPYKRDPTIQCYQCAGDEKQTECFSAQTGDKFKKCEKQILYNQVGEYCYTQYEAGTVKRGCLWDNTGLTVEKCNSSNCKTCNQNGCNKDGSDFTCIRCRSDVDTKCWKNAKGLVGSRCLNENNKPEDGCFSGVWHDVTIRGCVLDASAQVQSVCRDKNNPQCTICHTKDCNTKNGSTTRNVLPFTLMVAVCITLWKFK